MSEAVMENPTDLAESSATNKTSRMAFHHIWTIAKREVVSYFSSPIAYVFIVIFLLLAGFFTFMVGGFFERGQANLQPFFD